jgi:hypothetical protein
VAVLVNGLGFLHTCADTTRAELKNGPVQARDVEAKSRTAGISRATLTKAKKGVATSYKNGDFWVWELIEEGAQDAQEYQDAQESQEYQGAHDVLDEVLREAS